MSADLVMFSCVLTIYADNVVGPSSQGEMFFYGGPSDGPLLLGGGIIILPVIRRHFLAAAVDPTVSLSRYSILPMEFGR